jgi:hypothetical protein
MKYGIAPAWLESTTSSPVRGNRSGVGFSTLADRSFPPAKPDMSILSRLLFIAAFTPGTAMAAPRTDSLPVFVSSCAVMFGVRSSGTSATRAGFFGNAGSGQKRVDKRIQIIYQLTGYDSTAFQRIADRLCDDAPTQLTAAGYKVQTDSAKAHYLWADRVAEGSNSPDDKKMGPTRYLVYARSGSRIGVPSLTGAMDEQKLLGWDVTIGRQFGLRPVGVAYMVDFATIDAKTGSRFFGQNYAEVKGTLQVTVGAMIMSVDASDAKCYKAPPFGKNKGKEVCMLKGNGPYERGSYITTDDDEVASRDPITSVTESTTRGQKVTDALSGLANALTQSGQATLTSTSQYDVAIDMAVYEQKVLDGASRVLTKAMEVIMARSEKKK